MNKTEGGKYDGNRAVGVARFYMVLGAEYDIKPIEGLTATARVNHTGSQYADKENDKKLSDYTTLDLGVRYRTRVNADQNEMVWRLGVDNVTNKKYWSGANDTSEYLTWRAAHGKSLYELRFLIALSAFRRIGAGMPLAAGRLKC